MGGKISTVLSFDLDGTIFDPEGRYPVDPLLLEDLAELRSRGAVWVVNTGRTLFQTIQGLNQHRLPIYPDYIIAQESELYQPGPYRRWVSFGDWNAKCVDDHRNLFRSHARVFKRIRKFIETSTKASYFLQEDGPGSVVARSEEEIAMICEFVEEERRGLPLLSYQRNSVYLRFTHIKYHKGSTLGELGRLLGVPPEHTFAVGDNHNDVPMLDGTYARAVACPGNAISEVKGLVASRGGFVAQAPYSRGSAEAVRHFYSALLSSSRAPS